MTDQPAITIDRDEARLCFRAVLWPVTPRSERAHKIKSIIWALLAKNNPRRAPVTALDSKRDIPPDLLAECARRGPWARSAPSVTGHQKFENGAGR